VIIEPLFVDIATKNNFFSRKIGNIMKTLDADGFNEIDHWLSKEEYKELFQSFKKLHNIREMHNKRFRNHVFIEMLL